MRKTLILIGLLVFLLNPVFVLSSEIKLSVGVFDDPPLIFFDEETQPRGLFVDILKEIAKREGWELVFEGCKWIGCLRRLHAGTLDILGPVAYSKARARLFKFVNETIFINWGELFKRKGIEIGKLEDIDGKRILVAEGDIYALAFQELSSKLGFKIKFLFKPDYRRVFKAMSDGEADFGVVSRLFGMMYAGKYGVENTTIVFRPSELKFATRPDMDDEIIGKIDDYITAFKADKKSIYYKSLDKWVYKKASPFLPGWWKTALVLLIALLGFFVSAVVCLNRVVRKRTEALNVEIAKKVELESQLRETVHLYKTLFQFLPYPVLTLDENGRIIDCNNSTISFLGLSDLNAKKINFWELFDDVVRDRVKDLTQTAIDCALMGFTYTTNIESTDAGGQPSMMQAVFTSVFTGRDVYILCALHDLTEQVRLEQYYRAQWELLRNVIDGMPVPTTVIDYQGHVVVWNKATEILTGISRETTLNKPLDLRPLFGGMDLPVPAVLLLKKSPQEIEEEFHGKIRIYPFFREAVETYGMIFAEDGERKDVHIVSARLLDESGNVIGVVQCGRDITEERKLRECLIQAQKMEAVGRLAGGVAHDLNNILTFIMGCCDMLSLVVEDNKEAHDYVDKIRGAIRRAGKLGEQLLGFGRKQFYLPRYVNINDIVKSIASEMRSFLGSNINLELEFASDVLTTKVDPLQLEQALSNLIINAKDAMPEGGTLRISTECVKLGSSLREEHFEVPPGNYAVISVSDTGHGIRKDVLKHIFEPYFTTKQSGSGLGLAVVYGVVKQSGGSVVVESEPGKGTTFRLYFPCVDNVKAVQASEAMKESEERDQVRILLVDDDEQILTFLEQTLVSVGYDVVCARSGNQALNKLKEMGDQIDVVLSDVVLPDIDCAEYVDSISRACEDKVVIFTSGYSEDYLEQHGVNCDKLTHFVQKPFTAADLLAIIKQLKG